MIPPQRRNTMPGKMHRMHLDKVGEGVIYVPGGVPYEVVPVAEALTKYAPGSFMRLGNKEFVYAIAGNTLRTDLGAKNSLQQKLGIMSVVDAVAGVGTVSITVTGDNDIGLNELKGGEVVVFTQKGADTTYKEAFTRGIVSNNKITTTGKLVVVLDSPTPRAVVAATDQAECMASPYSAVITGSGHGMPVMGIPTVIAEVNQGLWLQVSGICWLSPQALVGVAPNTGLVFRHDGSLEPIQVGAGGAITVPDVDYDTSQYAGFVIAEAVGGGQGAPFVMLQIAH